MLQAILVKKIISLVMKHLMKNFALDKFDKVLKYVEKPNELDKQVESLQKQVSKYGKYIEVIEKDVAEVKAVSHEPIDGLTNRLKKLEKKAKRANEALKDTINESNIPEKNKEDISSTIDKANLNIDKNLKSKSKDLNDVFADYNAILKLLESEGVSKDGAKDLVIKVNNNLKQIEAILDSYLKDKSVKPENEAMASTLEKRALKLREDLKQLDKDIDSKFETYTKEASKEKGYEPKPFGWDLKTTKERSMELSVKEISEKAKKLGIDT